MAVKEVGCRVGGDHPIDERCRAGVFSTRATGKTEGDDARGARGKRRGLCFACRQSSADGRGGQGQRWEKAESRERASVICYQRADLGSLWAKRGSRSCPPTCSLISVSRGVLLSMIEGGVAGGGSAAVYPACLPAGAGESGDGVGGVREVGADGAGVVVRFVFEVPVSGAAHRLGGAAALERGVGIAPGPIFCPLGNHGNFIRVGCGVAWTPRIAGAGGTLGNWRGRREGGRSGCGASEEGSSGGRRARRRIRRGRREARRPCGLVRSVCP
jgi:hypothetical protein